MFTAIVHVHVNLYLGMGFLYLSQWFPLAFDGSKAGRIYFSAVLLVCLV